MSIEIIIGLFTLGVFVGFINILSAGGSLISLPVLIFFGLPSATANGTNRIAIIVQNTAAMLGFYKAGRLHWKMSLELAIPTTIGSLVGAFYAVTLSDELFNRTLAVVMVSVLLLMIFRPHQRVPKENVKAGNKQTALLLIAFTFIGFYGGFIQAGVGFLIIAFLTVLTRNLHLVDMHSIKTVVVTLYLLISTPIFIFNGNIDWGYALVLAIGSGIGGWLGGTFAVRIPEKVLQYMLIVIISLLSIQLLFF